MINTIEMIMLIDFNPHMLIFGNFLFLSFFCLQFFPLDVFSDGIWNSRVCKGFKFRICDSNLEQHFFQNDIVSV